MMILPILSIKLENEPKDLKKLIIYILLAFKRSGSYESKNNLLKALSGEEVDVTPVVSVTQVAVVEAMEKTGAFWPEAHTDAEKWQNSEAPL